MFGRSSRKQAQESVGPDLAAVLGTLPTAVLAIDLEGVIRYVNLAGEQLFELGAPHMCGQRLDALIPEDSTVCSLVRHSLANQNPVSEFGATLDSLRTGTRTVTVQVSPMVDRSGWVLLSLLEHSLAMKIGQQLSHRNAARSVTAMAAVLAHEIKNPLSGIRGSAQLLEQGVSEEDRVLTKLICEEADRIVKLVDRMEVFSEQPPLEREAVNIHTVIEHVRRLAQNGFGKHVRFIENFDPSLPPVWGNRDQLVQVFLNLVKNAAEACPPDSAEVVLTTAYQHGVRVQVPGTNSMMHLPLLVSVQDNGNGIPEDIQQNLFDPFVTTKPKGSGLGLALVAKIVNDHGGIIEFDSMPRRTVFKVLLPIVKADPVDWSAETRGTQSSLATD
jgi:two-component system nitrogen regulation sensor histidine kinase GlnL